MSSRVNIRWRVNANSAFIAIDRPTGLDGVDVNAASLVSIKRLITNTVTKRTTEDTLVIADVLSDEPITNTALRERAYTFFDKVPHTRVTKPYKYRLQYVYTFVEMDEDGEHIQLRTDEVDLDGD